MISDIESKKILGGGVSFSGALITALKGCINVFFEFGQTVGGAIRRITTHNLCKF